MVDFFVVRGSMVGIFGIAMSDLGLIEFSDLGGSDLDVIEFSNFRRLGLGVIEFFEFSVGRIWM